MIINVHRFTIKISKNGKRKGNQESERELFLQDLIQIYRRFDRTFNLLQYKFIFNFLFAS